MSGRNDGGPAFVTDISEGLSIRDYFAAKAMQAFIAREVIDGMEDGEYDETISRWSYSTADAMLEARKAGD